jgi:broad specificity phosphatase PhoE
MYGAKLLAEERNMEIFASPDWREMNFGDCEGLSFAQIQEKYPLLAENIANPGSTEIEFPGGESDRSFSGRIGKAFAALCERYETGRVCLVSHSGVGRAILSEFLHMPVQDLWSIYQHHAGLHVVDVYPGGGYSLRLLNVYVGPEGYYQSGPGWDFLNDNI